MSRQAHFSWSVAEFCRGPRHSEQMAMVSLLGTGQDKRTRLAVWDTRVCTTAAQEGCGGWEFFGTHSGVLDTPPDSTHHNPSCWLVNHETVCIYRFLSFVKSCWKWGGGVQPLVVVYWLTCFFKEKRDGVIKERVSTKWRILQVASQFVWLELTYCKHFNLNVAGGFANWHPGYDFLSCF